MGFQRRSTAIWVQITIRNAFVTISMTGRGIPDSGLSLEIRGVRGIEDIGDIGTVG